MKVAVVRREEALSRRFRLLLAVTCGVLACMLCLLYGRQKEAEAQRVRTEALERYGGELVSLVVATTSLQEGDIISRSNVRVQDWISDLAPADAITNLDEVLGQQVQVALSGGMPLTRLTFSSTAELLDIPSGYVALSLPLHDKLGLPSALSRGTKLAAYEIGETSALLISSDIQLLQELKEISAKAQVVLAVHPEYVSDLLAAGAKTSLRLVIPSDDVELGGDAGLDGTSSDDGKSNTSSADLQQSLRPDTNVAPQEDNEHTEVGE